VNAPASARQRVTVAAIAASLIASGCATSSGGIATAYVSPLQFQGYDCQQISAEMQRIHVRVNQLAGRLDKAAENDKALVGVGMLLFWPALFALGGTKEQEAEYARLKGEYEALDKVSIEKKCPRADLPVAGAAAAASAPAAGSASAPSR
jgi:hypothetical protein